MLKQSTDISKSSLPVMEQFYTIQGEGYHQGKAAYFIRLGGCDVGCVWCDVKESWDADAHPKISIADIVQQAAEYPARIAIITGGEPLMHNLDELTTALKEQGFRTHIETSGVHPLSGTWDWICFSPKKFKAPRPDFMQVADELKVIVYHRHDLEWAETFAKEVNPNCKLYLQPEWGREPEMLPLIINHVKMDPKWEISLQIHKYLNVP